MPNFKTLFDIRISHSYYQSGITPDLAVFPTEETARKLRGHRLLFRALADRVKVLYLTEPGSIDPLVDLDGLTLTFGIQLLNTAEFFNFTDLDTAQKTYGRGKLLFFSNDPANQASLDSHILDGLRGRQFIYQLPITAADPQNHQATLEVKNAQGSTVATYSNLDPDGQGAYRLSIDLIDHPTGRYQFVASDDSQGPVTEDYVLDDALLGSGLLGLVSITIASDSLDEYSLAFVRKEQPWAYYLVNKSGISLDDFDFDVEDESGDDGSEVYNTYTFSGSQTPDPADAVGGIDTLVFTSDQDIPCYDQPKLSIRLKQIDKNAPPPQATQVIIQNLPNPQPTSVPKAGGETAIYIYL